MTPRTIVSVQKLAVECERVRPDGYATDDEEFHPGVRCVAAPVRDASGRVVAAIGISAAVNRLPRGRFTEVGSVVIRVAGALGERLGFSEAEHNA